MLGDALNTHGRRHRVYTSYKSIHNSFAMLSLWDELGKRKNLIVNSKWSNAIVGHPNLKTKLRIWQPIKSEGLVSPKNSSLIQIQNFAIVFASLQILPAILNTVKDLYIKAISYAEDNILNALRMNLQNAQIRCCLPWLQALADVLDQNMR